MDTNRPDIKSTLEMTTGEKTPNSKRLHKLANKLVRDRGKTGRKRKRKKLIIWSSLLLAVLTGVAIWQILKPTPVEVAFVSYQRMGPTSNPVLRLSGYVTYPRISTIGTTARTPVIRLNFKVGDQVKQGDILAVFDDSRLQAQLQAQEISIRDLQETLARTQNLYNAGAASDAELQSIQTKLASARSETNLIRDEIAQTTVRAPYSGLIIDKLVEVGEIPTSGLCRLADNSMTLVSVDIGQEDIALINENQPAVVILDSYPETEYAATLYQILPTANQAKNTIQANIRVLKPDQRFIPQMSAKVFITNEKQDENQQVRAVLAVNKSVFIQKDNNYYVWQVKRGQAYERKVIVGDTLQNSIQIKSGLKADDRVIIEPEKYKLYQGIHVELK
jgi:membrane fusion protein (multidrug efflux system)